MSSTTIKGCRSCGGERLDLVLDLGKTPLANRLLDQVPPREPEPRFELKVVFCPSCSLVQITETVSPEVLFRDYAYFSSFSDEMLRHARAHALSLIDERSLGPNSLVIEIASNDGYLLKNFVERGVPVLGVEPARNIAKVANERGVRTRDDFFGHETAQKLVAEGMKADVILGNNVLAHVADLNGFVAGVAMLLKPGAIARFEFPYLGELLERTEFDTVYHEHLCYFSAHAIESLFGRHGLALVDVERMPIHGGSLRITVAAQGTSRGPRVAALLEEERKHGIADGSAMQGFRQKVETLTSDLRKTLAALKAEKKRVWAYGASAKGATLLNYMGVGKDTLECVVDRSSVKQGKFTPGTHLPIRPVEALLEQQPDVVLLLTWNFADEILGQQAEYRKRGGRFLIPVPEVRLA